MKKNTILKLSVVIMLSLTALSGFGTPSKMHVNTQQNVYAAVVEQKILYSANAVKWSVTAPSHDKAHESVETPLHLKEADGLSRVDTKRKKK